MITVFTPTYNRAYTLNNLYQSLLKQTNYDFEWIIVDDGSTDNTADLVMDFKKCSNLQFKINYVYQENAGKHVAINTGVSLAKGDYFFIVDSDDYLREDAISIIDKELSKIDQNSNLCGIVALRCYKDGSVIGGNDSVLEIETDFLSYRTKYKIRGDRAEIIKTSILKNYPFPYFENEKFCTEAVVWNRIAQKYNARFLALPIYICEYLEGGLTKSAKKMFCNNPRGMQLYYKELFFYDVPLLTKIKAGINCWKYWFMAKDIEKIQFSRIYLYLVIGWLLYKISKV